MLTVDDIALVRASFARVAPIKDIAADLFYQRLFEMAPQVRPLFPDDLREQKKKLMAMLAMAVGSLDELEALVEKVKALGARHVAYGATATHYEVVGKNPRPQPDELDNVGFVFFRDPDGNGWAVQQISRRG